MEDAKMDKVLEKLDNIDKRLVRVETLISERASSRESVLRRLDEIEKQLAELEKHKTQVVSFKDIITWAAMAGIAIWGVLR